MDQPTTQKELFARLARVGLEPRGLEDFHVYYPVSCASDREGSNAFTLRLADLTRPQLGRIMPGVKLRG